MRLFPIQPELRYGTEGEKKQYPNGIGETECQVNVHLVIIGVLVQQKQGIPEPE